MLTSIYLTMFLIGTGCLLLTLLLDHDHDVHHDISHDHDHGHHGVSLLSPKVIFAFVASFGAIGLLTRIYEVGPVKGGLSSLGGAVVFAWLVLEALRWVGKQQSTQTVEPHMLIGRTGRVTIRATDDWMGEVEIGLPDGQTVHYRAWGRGVFQPGDTVNILNINGDVATIGGATGALQSR